MMPFRACSTLLLLTSLMLSACTGPDPTSGETPDGAAPTLGAATPGVIPTDAAPLGSAATGSLIKPSKGPLHSSTAVARDPISDAQIAGTVPSFREIVQGAVRGEGKEVSLILVLSDEIPQEMPDETTYMIVAWNLAANKKVPTAGFSAEATMEGWRVSAAIDNDVKDYPGTVVVEGNTVTLTMPWSFVGGPHEFDWSAASTWIATSNNQSSSSADNLTNGHYPQKKKKKQ